MSEELKVQTIKPDPNCKYCQGSGEGYEGVSYGSTTVMMPSFCICVEIQCDEDTDEIVIDVDEQLEQEINNGD